MIVRIQKGYSFFLKIAIVFNLLVSVNNKSCAQDTTSRATVLNRGTATLHYGRKPVHIFIINIHGGFFTHGGEPLLAVGRHPDAVAFFYRVPMLVEHVNALTLQVK